MHVSYSYSIRSVNMKSIRNFYMHDSPKNRKMQLGYGRHRFAFSRVRIAGHALQYGRDCDMFSKSFLGSVLTWHTHSTPLLQKLLYVSNGQLI
ncbi:hypothetical protein CEXT_456361 [Caerostris extrusa]|uniref:Uncharacterized protein n=1 Tax=Caerostris extrusa TaxID=172846 RepID=A0AAV4UV36_CAEEX|nr:hypothetical protein CEXT_456361 [Caerostris extrusa]